MNSLPHTKQEYERAYNFQIQREHDRLDTDASGDHVSNMCLNACHQQQLTAGYPGIHAICRHTCIYKRQNFGKKESETMTAPEQARHATRARMRHARKESACTMSSSERKCLQVREEKHSPRDVINADRNGYSPQAGTDQPPTLHTVTSTTRAEDLKHHHFATKPRLFRAA